MTFLLTKDGDVKFWSDIDLGKLSDNTVYKVASLIKERYKVKEGIEIRLEKKIPVGAGLGGGSSNAATTIKVLRNLWNLDLREDDMHSLAAKVGSDVNFFLIGGTAMGEGRGERVRILEPIDFEMILLVKPDYGIRSGDAYQLVTEYGDNQNWKYLLNEKDARYCFNRFDSVLRARYPEINEIVDYMLENGAIKAIVSGSGSTVIGFYDNQQTYDYHYDYYNEKGFWCCQTKTKRRLQ